jgi:threonine dehydrogenase-like Zn-dependent dehydrogenase
MTSFTEAFVMTAPGTGALDSWPLTAGEVTIEVTACGLCQREYGVWHGNIPRTFPDVLGHEVVGCVVDGPWPAGTAVAGMGIQALARHVRVPAWQVAPVPHAGPEFSLVEPLACAVNAVEQDPSPPSSTAVVYGLGVLGQFIAAILARRGRRVVAVDSDAPRRELAAAVGAVVHPPDDPAFRTEVRAAGAAFECTADEAVLWNLSNDLAPGATLVIVAHHRGGRMPAGQLLDRWHSGGLKIRNAVPWTADDMAACVRAAASAWLDLSRFPIRCGSLADAPALLREAPRGAVLRHVVVV